MAGRAALLASIRQMSRQVSRGSVGEYLLCWPREVQSSVRVAKESWGLLSSDCRANRPHLGLCPEANVLQSLGLQRVGHDFTSEPQRF